MVNEEIFRDILARGTADKNKMLYGCKWNEKGNATIDQLQSSFQQMGVLLLLWFLATLVYWFVFYTCMLSTLSKHLPEVFPGPVQLRNIFRVFFDISEDWLQIHLLRTQVACFLEKFPECKQTNGQRNDKVAGEERLDFELAGNKVGESSCDQKDKWHDSGEPRCEGSESCGVR